MNDFEGMDKSEGSSTTDSTLTRVSTIMSFNSTFSTSTVIPAGGGGYGIPLDHLCRLITSYPSLQDADIVASECYTKRIAPTVVHRYLVLELRREGKKTVWIRLDRTRFKAGGAMRFVRSGAQTKANDVVSYITSHIGIV